MVINFKFAKFARYQQMQSLLITFFVSKKLKVCLLHILFTCIVIIYYQ
jgi:hypothetical protein